MNFVKNFRLRLVYSCRPSVRPSVCNVVPATSMACFGQFSPNVYHWRVFKTRTKINRLDVGVKRSSEVNVAEWSFTLILIFVRRNVLGYLEHGKDVRGTHFTLEATTAHYMPTDKRRFCTTSPVSFDPWSSPLRRLRWSAAGGARPEVGGRRGVSW